MNTRIVQCNPTSPGVRHRVYLQHDHVYKGRPKSSLTEKLKSHAGRNNSGKITVHHKMGRRRLYRTIDFKRMIDGVPAKVVRIEYCPYRTAHIALLSYANGAWSYVIAENTLRVGHILQNGETAPLTAGNYLPLKNIPQGTQISCVEMKPGKGAQLMRSAGSYATLVSKTIDYAVIRMRSGETRKVPVVCRAMIGQISNPKHNLRKLGKAGIKIHMGIRPTTRGVAMNPIDHPHGGGEGRTSGGRHPVSPWGMPTKGFKTRKNKRTDNMIVRRRNKK